MLILKKDIQKSFLFSIIAHLIIVFIFSALYSFPSFETKVEFKPIEVEIQNNLIFANLPYESNIPLEYKKDLGIKSEIIDTKSVVKLEKGVTTKIEQNVTKNEQTKEDVKENITENVKTTDSYDKPLITPIESKSNQKTESKSETSTSSSSTTQSTSTSTSSTDENIDNLIQQLISNQIADNSGQNAKDNIQWNAGANRWVIKKIKPVLPKNYQEKGNTISCKIYIEINKFGSVISAYVVQSTGFIELDQYIISVIKDWKFNQVTYDRIDSGYITIIFVFS